MNRFRWNVHNVVPIRGLQDNGLDAKTLDINLLTQRQKELELSDIELDVDEKKIAHVASSNMHVAQVLYALMFNHGSSQSFEAAAGILQRPDNNSRGGSDTP